MNAVPFCLAGMFLSVAAAAQVPSGAIPDGLGVNIHFTEPQPGEMEKIRDAGFRIVRMDFDWAAIEKQRGVYDFSRYDTLVAACEKHGIRILFIIDYANPLYDDNRSPDTDEGRAAMARFAREGVKRYRGKGILWEMYNEPNINPFWRPGKPDVESYSKLAIEVGKAIKAEAPEETYIGPATSGMDFAFLEGCFKAGCLEYWDAVSVHPYRQQIPETVVEDYRKLRLLIAKYAPKGKAIQVLSGEWGYSSAWKDMDEEKQGKLLARQWLVNLSQGISVSIWYDWRDDGLDPKEPEHHFGTVHHDFSPKPGYEAAMELIAQLRGMTFRSRVDLGDDRDWALYFHNDQEVRVVAWTTAGEPRVIKLPGSGIQLTLTDTPQYLLLP